MGKAEVTEIMESSRPVFSEPVDERGNIFLNELMLKAYGLMFGVSLPKVTVFSVLVQKLLQ